MGKRDNEYYFINVSYSEEQPHAGGRNPVNRRKIYQNLWNRVSENPLL